MFKHRLPAWTALAALLILQGCAAAPEEPRVIVVGLDGADPHVVDLLVSEGKLPHFARLRQEGAYGRLISMKPLLSPVIWTTIATGKTPDQHRIGHFTAVNQVTGEQLPVTSQMRKAKALWNIASDHDRSVAVIGWWATWPAETVKGSIVSDHLCYHFLFEEGFDAAAGDAVGKTHPPDLVEDVAPLVVRPGDLGIDEVSPFISVGPEELARPMDFHDEVGHFKWTLSTAESYRRIARRLWEADHPDLMMVYLEGLDSASHLFGHLFRAEGLAGELAEQQRRYGNAVEQWYVHADRLLGEFMEMMDEGTTLAVLSDHGFRLGALPDDPSRTRDMRRVSESYHTIEGILYLYGKGVKPHGLLDNPSILDVTPTLLALLGIPPGRDMPGRILSEGLAFEPGEERVATHETGEAGAAEVAADAAVDERILEKLGSLGYLDATSPGGERNLAAVLFEAGRYEEAVEAYRKLVEADPEDGALRASLAGALGASGRYDEALEQLTEAIRLQPLNPEAHHNRAVIHERNGDVEAAVADYRTALRYSPDYEPARRALRRLQASDRVGQPATPAEQLAYKIAEEASRLARRGDYREAMRRLDEAQRIAPRYALVYQYRSNVAYLMGDIEAAREALRRGLEIEPDNALFRENLRRLERQPAAP